MPISPTAAIAPVAVLIALGYLLRRSGFMPAGAWPPLERLVYFVFFPALLFSELARASFAQASVLPMLGVLVLAQFALAGGPALLRRLSNLEGPAYTSLVQGVVRFNSYMALALAASVFGPAATPLAAAAVAVLVPMANLLSIVALQRHGSRGGGVSLARSILANPLILACAVGAGWQTLGVPLPGVLADTLQLLSRATLALGLLAVGAGLQLGAIRRGLGLVALAAGGKLLLMPLLALGLGHLAGLPSTATGVAVLVAAMPTATSAYILARLLGGDAELMAAMITTQTLAALLTLPLLLAFLA